MKIAIAGYKGRMGQMLVRELNSGAWPDMIFNGGTKSTDNAEILFAADCVIDFTTPDATRTHLRLAAKHHKPIVIGTTGLSPDDMAAMHDAAQSCPLLYGANMSIGVNLLAALVEQAAVKLGPDFDIQIAETHHIHKKDSPSGTALMLGRCSGRADIDYHVQRIGDVVGDHTVSFSTVGERLELTHRAHDRSLFAKGALRAAQWLAQRPDGLYSMRDVLSL